MLFAHCPQRAQQHHSHVQRCSWLLSLPISVYPYHLVGYTRLQRHQQCCKRRAFSCFHYMLHLSFEGETNKRYYNDNHKHH